MKFENLFNIMHCDFFEVHKNGEIECIEYEMSGKMLAACKKYFIFSSSVGITSIISDG